MQASVLPAESAQRPAQWKFWKSKKHKTTYKKKAAYPVKPEDTALFLFQNHSASSAGFSAFSSASSAGSSAASSVSSAVSSQEAKSSCASSFPLLWNPPEYQKSSSKSSSNSAALRGFFFRTTAAAAPAAAAVAAPNATSPQYLLNFAIIPCSFHFLTEWPLWYW